MLSNVNCSVSVCVWAGGAQGLPEFRDTIILLYFLQREGTQLSRNLDTSPPIQPSMEIGRAGTQGLGIIYSMGIRGRGGGSQDIPEFWDTGPPLERAPVLQ